MAQRGVTAGLLGLVRLQDDVGRHALGQVERDRLVGLAHAARDVRRDLHANGLGAAARGHQHGGLLGHPLQALQGARATGFGGDDQPAFTVIVAQHDDAAAAQLRQGALDGGQGGGSTGMNLTRNHALPGTILSTAQAFLPK